MSEEEADLEVFPDAHSSVSFPGEAEAPAEASSSPSPAGALSSNIHGSEARITEATCSSPLKHLGPFV